MRKSFLPILLAGTLTLGGCGYGLGGLGGLGGILGGGSGGYGNQDFERAAVDACGREAARYGRVSITDVRAQSSSTLRVSGVVQNNYQQRRFGCSFRSDGRITDFDLD